MKEDSKGWLNLIIWVAIMAIVFGFGFFSNEPEFTINPIYGVKEYNNTLYWVLHPFTFLDALGLILFSIGTFIIAGAYKLFIGEQNVSKGELSWINWMSFALAACIGLCFIN